MEGDAERERERFTHVEWGDLATQEQILNSTLDQCSGMDLEKTKDYINHYD